jgi:RNA-splicing ligase RtcB
MGSYEVIEAAAIADCALAIEGASLAYKSLDEVVDTLHRLDISRKVVSLRPIGNIEG